jgi:hypothetical protein
MQDNNDAETYERHQYGSDRPAYLASHKSLAACQRELNRLTTALMAQVQAIADRDGHTATIRRSPDRCILQLGPVALTIAWLKSAMDSVAEGQLLIVVWSGTIAARGKYSPERPSKPATSTASIVWQETLAADAEEEGQWAWRSGSAASLSTDDLAKMAVERLQTALVS